VRPRLQRLVSRWQKPEPGAAAAPDAAAPAPVARAQPTGQGETKGQDETKRRLVDAQARLKQAVPPKDE
jgi:hypothetical protein